MIETRELRARPFEPALGKTFLRLHDIFVHPGKELSPRLYLLEWGYG